jgi:hypothetical protein
MRGGPHDGIRRRWETWACRILILPLPHVMMPSTLLHSKRRSLYNLGLPGLQNAKKWIFLLKITPPKEKNVPKSVLSCYRNSKNTLRHLWTEHRLNCNSTIFTYYYRNIEKAEVHGNWLESCSPSGYSQVMGLGGGEFLLFLNFSAFLWLIMNPYHFNKSDNSTHANA